MEPEFEKLSVDHSAYPSFYVCKTCRALKKLLPINNHASWCKYYVNKEK